MVPAFSLPQLWSAPRRTSSERCVHRLIVSVRFILRLHQGSTVVRAMQDTTNHPAWTGEENTVSSEDEHMARFLKRFGEFPELPRLHRSYRTRCMSVERLS